MSDLLYFTDPADPTHATIGVDLNGLDAGDETGFRFETVDWGGVAADVVWLSGEGQAGAEQAIRSHPPVEARIALFAEAVDRDAFHDLYRLLGQYVDEPGVLVWQPEDASEPLFWDTYRSPIEALYRGRDHRARSSSAGSSTSGTTCASGTTPTRAPPTRHSRRGRRSRTRSGTGP